MSQECCCYGINLWIASEASLVIFLYFVFFVFPVLFLLSTSNSWRPGISSWIRRMICALYLSANHTMHCTDSEHELQPQPPQTHTLIWDIIWRLGPSKTTYPKIRASHVAPFPFHPLFLSCESFKISEVQIFENSKYLKVLKVEYSKSLSFFRVHFKKKYWTYFFL